jgi:hypothetical protein
MVSGLRPRLVVGERGRTIARRRSRAVAAVDGVARAENMLHTRRFQAAG